MARIFNCHCIFLLIFSLSTEPPPASKRLRPLSQTPLVSHPNMEHSTSSQQGNAPAETTPTISGTFCLVSCRVQMSLCTLCSNYFFLL